MLRRSVDFGLMALWRQQRRLVRGGGQARRLPISDAAESTGSGGLDVPTSCSSEEAPANDRAADIWTVAERLTDSAIKAAALADVVDFDASDDEDGSEPVEPKESWRRLPRRSYSIAPLVNESDTLQKLVEVGVDLSVVERRYNASSLMANLNWQRHVRPVLQFLVDIELPVDRLGDYITRNPWIFQQSVDDLRARVNYLQSKHFRPVAITRVVQDSPFWLNMPVAVIDRRLGWLQREYSLSGAQVRGVVTNCSEPIANGTGHMQLVNFAFRQEFGFTVEQLKQTIIVCPQLWRNARGYLTKSFDCLHSDIGFSHERIVAEVWVLQTRADVIRARFQFLKLRRRAQFDPFRPNYVSLNSLCSTSDAHFCRDVAKCSVAELDAFQKTL